MQKTVADTMKGSAIHKVWVGNYRETASDRFTTRMIDRLFASLGLPKGAAVLDAGCGTGTNSHRLAAKGFRVTGVDLSGFALDEARRRGEGPDFRQGDLTALDLDNGSFDCVFCCGVLMHIPDFEQAIGELVRVLKPGGFLILTETNAAAPEMRAFPIYWKLAKRPVRVVRKASGFETWTETEEGPLVARKMRMPWLIRHLRGQGMKLESRTASELSEAYIYFGSAAVRSAIHAVNRLWFALRGPAALATGNLLVFRKG